MNDLMEWILFSLWNGKPKDLQLRVLALSFITNLQLGTIDFVFKIQKWDLEFGVHIRENFFQN
jgi:hypothetical protein